MYRFVIRGTRGTMPACGRRFIRYGGDTTCFSIETDEGLLVIDGGTGIIALNGVLADRKHLPPITVIFTHFHLDHLMGLPSFAPLYDGRADITFMADGSRRDDWRANLLNFMANPYWPAELTIAGANITFEDLGKPPGPRRIAGIKVSWCPVSHPQQCLAYKIEGPEATIVVATDHEHADSDLSAGFLEFCRSADHLIYDSMYTPEEYSHHLGWGHGNWQQGIQLALEAQVGDLILSHHDLARTDREIDEMVEKAKAFFPNTRAAASGMTLVC
jgi:phosphoribosyl 1,2-cyclic phosphodiesterase